MIKNQCGGAGASRLAGSATSGACGATDPVIEPIRMALSAPSSIASSVGDCIIRQSFSSRKNVNAVQEDDWLQAFSQSL
jgi:hypothetical protein